MGFHVICLPVLFCFVLSFGKTKGNENYFQYFYL